MFDEYPHPFDQEEALARARALTDHWRRRLGLDTRWEGYRGQVHGRVLGIAVNGTVWVEPRRMRGHLRSGSIGLKLGGRRVLLRQLARFLDPARSLEELQATGEAR